MSEWEYRVVKRGKINPDYTVEFRGKGLIDKLVIGWFAYNTHFSTLEQAKSFIILLKDNDCREVYYD